MIRFFAIAASVAIFAHALDPHSVRAESSDQPNIVIVMTDDQGYGDLSCHGNPTLKTPALDLLYQQSIRLTNYHVSPTCSPTRAALLTGHYSNRTGVWHTILGRSLLRENEITLGQYFQDAGYATGMFGKWHLGDNAPFRAEDRGFQTVVRHGGGGVGQTPDYWDNSYTNDTYWKNGQLKKYSGYCTDVFFDEAKQFIADQHRAGKPFLAYIATNAAHGPMHALPEDAAPYAALGTHVANFYGMIANIDRNVGQLRDFLATEGLADNTIFIFTTDNGTSSGAKSFNAGMRGSKGSEYDGGHRVPFFIHWPARGWTNARDITTLTAHVDIVPTLLEICNVPNKDVHFDGRSLLPLLRGSKEVWPDRVLVTDSQRVKDPIFLKQSAVMTDRWRLINGKQLFDMPSDPSQEHDVANQHPDVVHRLNVAYSDWWKDIEPSFASDATIHLGDDRESLVRLTCHDWIADQANPWNQAAVRNSWNGDEKSSREHIGYWNVKVITNGAYAVRLRRWPSEVDKGIVEPLEAGPPVPGERGFRETPGRSLSVVTAHLVFQSNGVELVRQSQPLPENAKEIQFDVSLASATGQLHTWFETPTGDKVGAYYVYVSKTGEAQP